MIPAELGGLPALNFRAYQQTAAVAVAAPAAPAAAPAGVMAAGRRTQPSEERLMPHTPLVSEMAGLSLASGSDRASEEGLWAPLGGGGDAAAPGRHQEFLLDPQRFVEQQGK